MKDIDYPVMLITGTIQVNKYMPYVKISNVTERLNAYIDTIKWAIEKTLFQHVVFCENSNFPLDTSELEKMAQVNRKKFEYITFGGNEKKMIKQGKGYGEGEIISYALDHSELLKTAKHFVKITGRIIVENIDHCIRSVRNYFMMVEGEKKIDTRFYCVKIQDYDAYLRYAYEEVFDERGIYLEHVFYKVINQHLLSYRSFYEMPWIKGISGSTGESYELNRGKRTRVMLNYLCRINVYNSIILWKIIHRMSRIWVKNKNRNGK